MTPRQKIVQAKSDLIMQDKFVFYSNLMWKLEFVEDKDPAIPFPYMWTDGVSIGYNPEWVENAPIGEIKGAIVHEITHNANGHGWRRMGRDPDVWNQACDYAINPDIIATTGLQLPGDVLIDPQFEGKAAEEIYKILYRKQPGGSKKPQPGNGDGPGEIRDLPAGPGKDQKQAEWEIAVVNAANLHKAMNQGRLPGGIKSLVDAIKDPAIDWKAALRRFFEFCARNDYSWKHPNMKYFSCGLYLPGLRSEQMPEVVVYGDSSGSMFDRENRELILTEAASIIGEVKPELTHFIYGDTKFQGKQEFDAGSEVKFKPTKGGGGTDFCWIGKYIEKQGWNPAAVICVTDLEGSFPDPWPWTTIWACTNKTIAPFGETLEIRV